MAALNLLFLLVSQGQGTPSFVNDPRLDRPVALTACVQPLSQVAERLSKEIETPLQVDAFLREDLVVLVTKPRPARETMDKLAKHFGWRWVPASGGGYRIEPTEEFRRKAKGGQPLESLPQLTEARAFAKALLPKLARLTPAQMAEAKRASRKGDDEGNVDRQMELAFTGNPLALPVCRFYADLSDDQLMETFHRRRVISTHPGTFAYGMSDRVRSDAWQAVRSLGDRMAEDYRADPENNLEPFDASKVVEIRFQVSDGVGIDVTLIGPDRARLLDTWISFQRPLVAKTDSIPKELEPFIGQAKIASATKLASIEPLLPFASALADIAKKVNLDVICDAYDSYFALTAPPRLPPKALSARCLLTTEDGWLSCRARHWPGLRSETIPRSVWSRLEGRHPRRLSLNERATLASLIDRRQAQSRLLLWQSEGYSFYRFWAALPANARDRLTKGEALPFSSLPTETHDFLYEATKHGGHSFAGFLDEHIFREPELGGAFDFAKAEADADYAILFPRWLSSNAALSLKTAELPGIYCEGFEEMLTPSVLAEVLDKKPSDWDADLLGTPHLASVQGMRFFFTLAPGLRIERQEVEFAVGKEVPFDPKTWPADLLHHISAAKERAKLRDEGNHIASLYR